MKTLPPPETQLAYLGFQRILPVPPLQQYVRSFWYLQGKTLLASTHEEFMHPRGGFSIVFNLGDNLQLDAQTVTETIFLDGANTVSRKMGFCGQTEMIGIRFYEGGAYPFLGLPLNELRNKHYFLDALKNDGLLRLQHKLQETSSLVRKVRLLEEWLFGRLAQGKAQHPIISAALVKQQTSAGRLPIPSLASAVAMSQRQLERLYQSQVGISPKKYAQLLRVEQARFALKTTQNNTMTAVSAILGYFDQSHFIREFQAIVGMTPLAYFRHSHRNSATRR